MLMLITHRLLDSDIPRGSKRSDLDTVENKCGCKNRENFSFSLSLHTLISCENSGKTFKFFLAILIDPIITLLIRETTQCLLQVFI